MDFGALPPEINSGRMYLGPGPGTLLAASAGWESLAAELTDAANGYRSVIASLTDESWTGPTAMSMAAAAAPYMAWMTATAAQCQQTATQATAAAAAFDAAYAMTVPPPLIVANRAQLMALIATNILGQNTPAIMATEAEYGEMWAQDATAMYNYAASSASASTFSNFTSPPQTTNPDGVAGQAGAVAKTAGTQVGGNVQTTTAQLMSSVPQTLQSMSTPGAASATGVAPAAEGTAASLGASGATTPLSALSSVTGSSGKAATKSASTSASAVSGLANALTPAASGLGLDALGIGSDMAGFGADGGGLGLDGYGLNLDFQGLALDYEGAGSILGAEGVPGFPTPGSIGGISPPIPGLGGGASAGLGEASSLGTLSVPPTWSEAASAVTPLPMDANAMPGGYGAATVSTPTTGISKLPLGGMIGRESDGAVQRIGFRTSLIPRSPVAG
ncbi:PPE family protein [Mycobacterium alsense]|uniref:PPE family protein n=1 Tax=Mycobacterium alsense TaxID=324058 RepID=A0AA41XUB4_9MYCO|nr:PPE family protein [Mycobacterium alsense]MCV7381933.1 PPE family protein [Mycobacterium alsense]OQZ91508.1 PPE family protein [Mycobacterium alsense]